ncbi:g5220 [Coccomyxa viridis]|uniref:G5220 protein n=1 Tax=Coccomyxa viridis TaxID=1274662 RepID=A0ABP1FS95_9CHLO
MAAGAKVQTAGPSSRLSWQSVKNNVRAHTKTDQGERVVAICLSPIKAGDRFWSFKLAERHWNAHAFINIATLLNNDSTVDEGSGGVIKSAYVILATPQCMKVQRLDQPTGSPVMVAKSRPVLSALSAAFLYHEVKKTHLALICGRCGAPAAQRSKAGRTQRTTMTPAVRRSVMLMRRRARLMRPLVAAARAMTAARYSAREVWAGAGRSPRQQRS